MSTAPENVCPKGHVWTDPEYARHCCNPDFEVVQSVDRADLAKMGAVLIRPVGENMLFRGWVAKNRQMTQHQVEQEALKQAAFEPKTRR